MNHPQKQFLLLSVIAVFVLFVPGVVFAEGANFLETTLWNIVVNFFGMFVALGGLLLNSGINDFVIGFGDGFKDSGVGASVNFLWLAVRDIFNLTFIFGLIYLGFKMILNSDDSNTRRWLVHLILAALLVNFSLFITKSVVDFTNILATEIVTNGFIVDPTSKEVAISDTFMDNLGITNLLSFKIQELPNGLDNGGIYGYIFGTMILFIVMAFVFAAGGLLLIIRYAALCIYMILSPLMFIGWVFPGLQSYTNKYWSGFLGRAFFAPVYILLVYFSAKILSALYTELKVNGSGPAFTKSLTAGGNAMTTEFAGTFPPFILSCVFLIASIVIAQKMGADGAGAALSFGKKARKRVQRFVAAPVTKPAGYIARSASNRAGNFMNRKVDQWQKSQGVMGKIANNKFLAVGIDDAMRGTASKMKGAKFGLANTADEITRKQSVISSRVQVNKDIQAGQSALNNTEMDEGERQKILAKAQQAKNNLSQKDLEMMYANDKKMFEHVIGDINASTFDKLMDSDALTPSDKDYMSEKRRKAIEKTVVENGKILSEDLQNLSIKQIEALGDEFIRNNAHLFSQSQMDDIKKSTKFTEGQKGAYLGSRKQKQIAMASNPDDLTQLFSHNQKGAPNVYSKRKKAAEIANLPFEVFISTDPATGADRVNTNAIGQIDGAVLEEIFAKKTMTPEQRDKLRDAIIDAPRTSATSSALDYLSTAHGTRNWS